MLPHKRRRGIGRSTVRRAPIDDLTVLFLAYFKLTCFHGRPLGLILGAAITITLPIYKINYRSLIALTAEGIAAIGQAIHQRLIMGIMIFLSVIFFIETLNGGLSRPPGAARFAR